MNARAPASELRIGLIGGMMVGLGPVSVSILSPALPRMAEDFGVASPRLGLAITLFLAGFATFQLVCGTLSDRIGRKPVSILFLSLFLISSMTAMLSQSLITLLAARFFQGVGAAVGVSVGRAIVRDNFEGEQSARVLNLIAIILSLGPTTAPSIGGLIVEFANWHTIFAVLTLWSLALLAAIVFLLDEVRQPRRDQGLGALGRSARRLLTTPSFLLPTLGVAGVGGSTFALASVLPFIIVDRLAYSPSAFGLLMVFQSGMYLVGSISFRILSRRLRPARVLAAGLCMITGGALLLTCNALLPFACIYTVMGPIALLSSGAGHAMPFLMTGSMQDFPEDAGMASSLMGFSQFATGFAISAAASLLGDPVLAIGTVFPLGLVAGVWGGWRWSRIAMRKT